jgi:hypothetical protein
VFVEDVLIASNLTKLPTAGSLPMYGINYSSSSFGFGSTYFVNNSDSIFVKPKFINLS